MRVSSYKVHQDLFVTATKMRSKITVKVIHRLLNKVITKENAYIDIGNVHLK
jgi:hypothetical protein